MRVLALNNERGLIGRRGWPCCFADRQSSSTNQLAAMGSRLLSITNNRAFSKFNRMAMPR
jgi:hypothetical protein